MNEWKTRYDSRATDFHFKEVDQVWMYYLKRRRGLSPRLQQNWEGPYTIVKKLNDVIYRVQSNRSTNQETDSRDGFTHGVPNPYYASLHIHFKQLHHHPYMGHVFRSADPSLLVTPEYIRSLCRSGSSDSEWEIQE
ncbi:hypothetical protein AVEN_195922-1 [Araneus ventricosus]|uniref:Integrase p58-like C-terminal domain-containing protein n=1 Tax=Araneus ventricosus TaxID=182803 RepID=A0A4Y2RKF4_ARAVE|nr:hypothetical protein AVEN_195922-1 [Araneus ventricosus]